MGRQERLQKEFDAIEGKLRFFRSAILALLSALVWSAYALIERKVGKEILILVGIGIVTLFFLVVRTKSLEAKELDILEQLEKE